MEATEGEAAGILGKILPPRLEDAGLEDCALPPDAIKEAFAKAAMAVGSLLSASSDGHKAEAHCVQDPSVEAEDCSDALVGITDGVDYVPGACHNEKGGGVPEVAGDEVAVRDGDETVDEVVVVVGDPTVPQSAEDACVDALQGLEIGDKSQSKLGKKPSDADVSVDDGREEKVLKFPF